MRKNRMNNKGIGSGIAIIIILIVALLIAFLAMKNMGSFGFGSKPGQPENVVEQAQDAVDAINDRIQQQYSAVEQP